MQVYSKKIIRFIGEIKNAVKAILAREVGLRVFGSRFYDKKQVYSYPIKVVIFNNKSMLGYFAADFHELGFHEMLMHAKKEQLYDVIRHELAHYLAYIQYGPGVQSHGPEFRTVCEMLGWGEEVFRATICLDEQVEKQESAVLRKVQKLMALASSSNVHEAEQAMIKSRELLLKHNIEFSEPEEEEEKIFLKRVLKQKKENAKMRAIATILDTFFVNTVYSRAQDGIYLEIVGTAVNVEIAEYVANFLDVELENQWDIAKKKFFDLKGTVAKNSFFLGIAKGYCSKISALKQAYSKEVSQALLVLEKKLVDAQAMVYPRLRYSRSQGSFCAASSALGEQVGRSLNINPALNSRATQSGAFLVEL
jgi:hypothetical protein